VQRALRILYPVLFAGSAGRGWAGLLPWLAWWRGRERRFAGFAFGRRSASL